MHKTKVQATARVISDLGSPSVVATAFLVGQPLLHPQVSWGHALLAATFVTLIPTACLYLMRQRGLVSNRHVTERSQRAPIMIIAGASIVVGLAILGLVHAPPQLFQEVGGILLGLVVCFAITAFWKVSIHSAVGAYVLLAVTAAMTPFGPVVVLSLSALMGWSRVKLGHHTYSQVLAGQLVGCAVYLVRSWFLLGL